MVVFDANFLMIAMRPNIPASVSDAKERINFLMDKLQKAGERIIVPTPVLTELLVRAEQAAGFYVDEIQKSARFRLAPFGTRAAIEVSIVISSAIKRKNKKDGSKESWAKVNFDRQIAAIGKVEGAHTIYTDDDNLQKFSKRMGLNYVALADTEIPPDPHPLLKNVGVLEGLNEKQSQAENSSKLQPDPHRGNGDTSRETKIEGTETNGEAKEEKG